MTVAALPGGRRLRRIASVREVDREAWNRLAGDNPLLGHTWLCVMESQWREPVERSYLLLEEDGRLAAAAVCYVDASDAHSESVDDLLFGRLGGVLSLRPALVCGFPWGAGSSCIIDAEADGPRRYDLAAQLVDAVTAAAAREGRTAVFLSVAGSERTLRSCLSDRGYSGVRHEPVYALDVDWPDFEAYWRSLPSKNIRKNIRRELNKCRKQGVVIEVLDDPAECQEQLQRIVDRHFQRYGWREFPYRPGWFSALKQALGGDAVVTVARQQGRPVGVAVSLRREGTRQMILACVDHEAEGGNLTHFNLAYYRGLEDCIEAGDRRYIVGPGQHVSRRRRGFRAAESYLFCRPPGRLGRMLAGAWLRLLGAWLQRKRTATES